MNTNTQTERLLTPEELAETLRVKKRTVQIWRINGKGPKFITFGNLVRYRPQDVNAWLDQQVDNGSAMA